MFVRRPFVAAACAVLLFAPSGGSRVPGMPLGVVAAVAYNRPAHQRITLHAVEAGARNLFQVADLAAPTPVPAVQALMAGAWDEDDLSPVFRVCHHFHEPTKNAGITFPGCRALLRGDTPLAAPRWSQGAGGNLFHWLEAREAQLLALTGVNSHERKRGWYGVEDKARNDRGVFRLIGHVMHLLQDQTSPAHTRDDEHPVSAPYEDWVTEQRVADIMARHRPLEPDPALLAQPVVLGGPTSPVANLWDVDVYVERPSCSFLSRGSVGLSEFVAAHFYSRDTAPEIGPDGYNLASRFPCPAPADLVSQTRSPFYSLLAPSGEVIDRSLRRTWRDKLLPGVSATMDDPDVIQHYANHLVPLATGFTKAVLDHFFRGMVTASGAAALEARGLADGSVEVVNRSGAALGPGQFELWYDRQGDGSRVRHPPVVNVGVLADGDSMLLPLDLPALRDAGLDPEGSVVLVFVGLHGHEPSAIAARECRCEGGLDAQTGGCPDMCAPACLDEDGVLFQEVMLEGNE